ncbi:hypothetical protein GC425_06700 [Corynebacterium sp. zg254]|uniref:Lipoprotein n=1 Tax=Corynebacterium zhongnanshanii TaxID=2768834 RepID=A0ABQ6VDI9_9CORY|nr:MULTISPECIES: hypothetical protein [Corynebacterium]KAB3520923.1 hypothetical protein F8377_06720 [Corynebacterium zhongnanshanii]MCR5914553.1 hypothetical protein [Corynebacterium sp. zg254]
MVRTCGRITPQRAASCALLILGMSVAACSAENAPAEVVSSSESSVQKEASGERGSASVHKKGEGQKQKQDKDKNKDTDITGMDERTSMAVVTDQGVAATDNAREARPGLSVIKLYIADYALRDGASSPEEFQKNAELAKRMISGSDDFAADILYNKYPYSIDQVASEYKLANTYSNGTWGGAYTSAYDVAQYLHEVKKKRPQSLILQWMHSPLETAVDGTKQQWGTARLAGAEGTKWGWSDSGRKIVASATLGGTYTAAAFTWGSADDQNNDIDDLISQINGPVDKIVSKFR